MKVTDDMIVKEVRDFYLSSRDFNGIPAADLLARLKAEWPDLSVRLAALVSEHHIDLALREPLRKPPHKAHRHAPTRYSNRET
jgi:hypothetical protein